MIQMAKTYVLVLQEDIHMVIHKDQNYKFK